MAQSVTVAAVIAQIRSESDTESGNQATSIATDAEILVWLNKGYRRLFDLINAEAGDEYFAKTATLTAPTFALPADFYRDLDLELPTGGVSGGPLSIRPFNFADRNDYAFSITPRYRIQNGAVAWAPTSAKPTTSVTLWYIPTPADLASAGSFDAVNGWDDYVVKFVVREIRRKQEYDLSEADVLLQEAADVVKHNAPRIRGYQETVSMHNNNPADEWNYNG